MIAKEEQAPPFLPPFLPFSPSLPPFSSLYLSVTLIGVVVLDLLGVLAGE